MLRNYLAAALRNLVRNKLYAAINIAGLSVGITAALLIALFVRDEFSYDRWIPGHERTYAVLMRAFDAGNATTNWNTTTIDMAALLKLDFPEIEEAARIRINPGASVRRGNVNNLETIWWADANVFRVFPLHAIAGDLATALEQPDGLVLTRRMARKYFGRDDPIGETLTVNLNSTFRVTAVLEDLPSNTTFAPEIILAGRAASSLITFMDARQTRGPDRPVNVLAVYTYIRLRPGTSIATLRAGADGFAARRLQDTVAGGALRRQEPVFVPLADLHLTPFGSNPMTPPGSLAQIRALVAVGLIVMALAVINFVNLMTARANHRLVEIGVRKVSGADRRHLVVQFIGEAILYVAICGAIAVVAAKLMLPGLNGYLQRRIAFDPLADGPLMAASVGAGFAIGVLAGFYPALVLSAFRPAQVLRGRIASEPAWRRGLQQTLVALQFAILIGLMVSAGIVYRQTGYAENEGLKLAKDQIVLITTACRSTFKDDVAALPGVSAAACSAHVPVRHYGYVRVSTPGGADIFGAQDPVDFGFFGLYGLHPLAGRFFDRAYGKDRVIAGHEEDQPNVVINATAAAKFGFASPAAAIGQSISFRRFNTGKAGQMTPMAPAEIVGVVDDFPVGPVTAPILPTIFFVDPGAFQTLQVKLNGRDPAQTLADMGRLWAKYTGFPFAFTFFDKRVEAFYVDMTREGQLLGALSAVAVFIAGLGLLGLATFAAERRTKEIGIRKAMGASRMDILRLILSEFAKPVLWANAIAWPVGYLVMRRWLDGFAYHVALSPWVFLAASGLALVIALATVAGHALMVARSQPAAALRYE